MQGKGLVDAALANGVKFFVYSSVDRGGPEKSYDSPTDVPHFISKHKIEHHLVDSARGTDMQWTILRPVAFMENFTPGFGTKVMATGWRAVVKHKPLQLISVRDIGWFAARAFLHPEQNAGRAISLAGDELTLDQANAAFAQKVNDGKPMPETFQFLVRIMFWFSAEFGNMFRWFYTHGYGADVKALRAEHPGLLSFADWLATESDWAKKTK